MQARQVDTPALVQACHTPIIPISRGRVEALDVVRDATTVPANWFERFRPLEAFPRPVGLAGEGLRPWTLSGTLLLYLLIGSNVSGP